MRRILPILFNEVMVRAILEGRKTATRRAVKQTIWQDFVCEGERVVGHFDKRKEDLVNPIHRAPCHPGDILYVRETWAFVPCIECMQDYDGKCSCNKQPVIHEDKYSSSEGCYVYREECTEKGKGCIAWSPSIHMPKQAARIWLEVTYVGVEQLRDIDGRGVLAEGIDNGKSNPSMGRRWENMQRMAFSELWDSTIKKAEIDRYGWRANPWVWVIRFERCGKPESEG